MYENEPHKATASEDEEGAWLPKTDLEDIVNVPEYWFAGAIKWSDEKAKKVTITLED